MAKQIYYLIGRDSKGMPLDIEDYNRWAKNFKEDGGEPCIRGYLRHLVYKEINQEGKHTKDDQIITIGVME